MNQHQACFLLHVFIHRVEIAYDAIRRLSSDFCSVSLFYDLECLEIPCSEQGWKGRGFGLPKRHVGVFFDRRFDVFW